MITLSKKTKNITNTLSKEDKSIIVSLENLKTNIDIMHNQFNFITEPLLIDSCIYEMSSLQNKYSYYLKLCKERGLYMSKNQC